MTTKTEKEKMLTGQWFQADDADLYAERVIAKKAMYQINRTEDAQKRHGIIQKTFGQFTPGHIEAPIYFDYGYNIHVGKSFYANFNCVFLDAAKIKIGNFCQLGPNVQLYTSNHPLDATKRKKLKEIALPITIGDNIWIGGGAIICPGVTIGDNAVVAAGAVVIKDVLANTLVGGNPAKKIKSI